MALISCQLHHNDLNQRLDTVRALLAAAHPPGGTTPDISREVRGLAIVLLYASYENLLTSLCATLLDAAANLRVGNKRLRNGLKVFAAHPELKSLGDSGPNSLWVRGLAVIDRLEESRICSVNSAIFPNDGSHFRTAQVRTFCRVFGLPDPAPVLREVWSRIDVVVSDRNAVAHGRETPDDVGRRYTEAEISALVHLWDLRWTEFIDWVEASASSREFYRKAR